MGPGHRALLAALLLTLLQGALAGPGPRSTREAEEEGSGAEPIAVDTTNQEAEPVPEDNLEEEVVVLGGDPSDQIKEENVVKCSKCLKNSFRYRHDGFCGKCVQQEVINVKEQEELETAIRCRKCGKQKFRSRNALLCTDICSAHIELPITTEATAIDKYTKKKEVEKKDSVLKKKETDKMNKKLKKKNQKQEEREKRRQEKQQRKLEKKNKKFGYVPASWSSSRPSQGVAVEQAGVEVAQLGPLGHILQAIIMANTW